MTAWLAVAVVALGACPQPKGQPEECITLTREQSDAGAMCVDVELVDCRRQRKFDQREAEAMRKELQRGVDASKRASVSLNKMIDRCARVDPPPVAAWYEQTWLVAGVSVAATVAVVALVR